MYIRYTRVYEIRYACIHSALTKYCKEILMILSGSSHIASVAKTLKRFSRSSHGALRKLSGNFKETLSSGALRKLSGNFKKTLSSGISQEALRKLSGDSQEAFRRFSGDS